MFSELLDYGEDEDLENSDFPNDTKLQRSGNKLGIRETHLQKVLRFWEELKTQAGNKIMRNNSEIILTTPRKGSNMHCYLK